MSGIRNQGSTMYEKLEAIAQKYFELDTLRTRNSDAADFPTIAIWDLRAALEAAYNAGKASK